MIRFKLNDKTVEVATKWSEVTVKQFIDPNFLSGQTIKLLAALCEVKPEELAKCTEDLSEKFRKTSDFMKKAPAGWKTKEIPAEFTFMDKVLTVPVNLESKMFGQKIMMQEAIVKHDSIYQSIPDLIAIYFGAEIYPDDWFDRIDELKEEVLPMPIIKVAAIADFFLISLLPSLKSGRGFWNKYLMPIRKVR